MQTRFMAAILCSVFLSACSSGTPAPIIEPTATAVPPTPTTTPDADALRLWGDKNASVTADRLGKGVVYAMALSPDGKTIAVTGLLSVSTYDFNSLELLWTSLLEPKQPPGSTGLGQVVWSPDSSGFTTLSEVGTTVWDAKTGEQLLIFKGDQYSDTSFMWMADGKLVAQNDSLGNEIVWDVQTGEEVATIEINDGTSASDWTGNQRLLAKALTDRGIVVWDTQSKQELYPPLKVCDGYCVDNLKLSPDGMRIAVVVGGERKQLGVWDLKTGEPIFVIESPYNYTDTYFAWSPDGRNLAAAFNNGPLNIWDGQTGEQLQALSVVKMVGLAWSLDGNHLITLSQYESLTVWDVKTGEPVRSLGEHTSWVMNLAWSPDGNVFASGAEDGEIALWDPTSGKRLMSFDDPEGWVTNLTWSPDGKQIATGGQHTITIRSVETGKQVRELNLNSQLSGLAWSPDGSRLASVSVDRTTILWDPFTLKQLQKLPTNYSSGDLVWSPGGDLLSTSYPYSDFTGTGEQVTLWNPQTGEPVLTQKGMVDLAWSPLGDLVASISDNGTGYGGDDTSLILWDPRTGKEVRRFDTGILLFQVDWSPDGNYLIASGAQEAENALLILDAQNGAELHRLPGHYDFVTRVAWSPRGDLIASSSWDGTVMIWRVHPVE